MSTTRRLATRAVLGLTLVGAAVFGGAGAAQADTGHFDTYSSVAGGHGYGSSVVWSGKYILLNGGRVADTACDNKGSVLQIASGGYDIQADNKSGCKTTATIPDQTIVGYSTYSYIRIRTCLYVGDAAPTNCGAWLRVNR